MQRKSVAATKIQSCFRVYVANHYMSQLKNQAQHAIRLKACTKIQSIIRRFIACIRLHHKHQCAIQIQSIHRKYTCKRNFNNQIKKCVKIQSIARAYIARKNYMYRIQSTAAITIQRRWRGYLLHEEAKYMETLANNIRKANALFNIVWPKYDVDGRGIIEAKETKVMLQDFTGTQAINKDEVHTFLVSIDEDKNGKIDQNELVQYIVSGLGMSADEMAGFASRGHFQNLVIDFFHGVKAAQDVVLRDGKKALMKYFYNKKTISFVQDSAAITMQCCFRRRRRYVLRKQSACVKLQAVIRKYLTRERYKYFVGASANLKIELILRGGKSNLVQYFFYRNRSK